MERAGRQTSVVRPLRATWEAANVFAGYFDLLAAVVRRARLDAAGKDMNDLTPRQRPRCVDEAQQWLTWAAQELHAYADHDRTSHHNRGRKL